MKTPRVTLSICIPTYNRAALLEETLNSILTQLEPRRQEQLEIVISDNASADETPELVARFCAAYPAVHWNCCRQPKNKGFDANILNTAILSQGEFLYFLSDDDLLLPGALEKMWALIAAHPNLDAFCLNSRSFTHDPSEETVPAFAVASDRVIPDRDACLRFVGTRITFISLLMFRRSAVDPAAYGPYIGSLLPQSYLYLDVLASGRGMLATSQAFLGTRDNNTGGYNFFEVFVTQFGHLMRYARGRGFSAPAVRAVLSGHLTRFIVPFVVAFKVRGAYGRLLPDYGDGARRLWNEYGLHPVLVLGLLPLLLLPGGLVRLLHRLARRVRRHAAGPSKVQ